ncbi:PAC2 family protein [Mycobacterium avium]|uniref:PAC2 family protein n=1 Tax=Mycobacterium avium TaxID=1764 RepID=UPI000D0E8CA0|nr:PAC2 family protein [Mycobacterium avium]
MVAPLTFLAIAGRRVQLEIFTKFSIPINIARVIHRDQKFKFHRPILAHDRLYFDTYLDSVIESHGTVLAVIRQVDGVTRELVWPAMRISHCRPPGSDRDVVLMHGVEPNMRWRTFCAELVAIADKLNVDTVVILGALLADTPHTRPVPVSGAAYSPESAKRFGLEESRYEGPTGIAGVFQDACVAAGIPAVTFWAAVPHYVSQPPNPKATVALLRRVEDVLDIEVPLADLPTDAEEWEQAVTEMTAEDEDLAEYVQSLEQRGDAEVDMNDALGKIDGDALAAEFERYLRRRRPGFGR